MGRRGLLTLLAVFNEASSSKEGNFTTAVDSAVEHLPLFPVVDREYAKYPCKVPLSSSSLPGFLRSLDVLSPLRFATPLHPP